jgi:hypothetical protein
VNVYPFIEAEKRCRRNVKRACELLKVSRAAFYEYLSGPSRRDQDDADLAAKIQAVHEESKGRYGAPRVHAELRRRGQRHGRKRVARLMRQAGLQGRAARRWKKTTIPDPAAAARADRMRRDFTADASRLNSRRSLRRAATLTSTTRCCIDRLNPPSTPRPSLLTSLPTTR